jgi:hypothetical protein
MKGLPLKAFEAIERMIKDRFDSISMKFLGLIPTQTKTKNIIFNASKDNIIGLFLKALGSKEPNELEEQTLKTMMRVSNGYLDALRDRSTSRIMHDVDSYVTNQSLKNSPVSVKKIDTIINKEMGKAGNNLKMIVNSESNKAANTGTALQIAKLAENRGEGDPTVFFIIVDDEKTGFYEYILHTLPDRKTPRLWKLSEISASYYQPGGQYPSLSGLHVFCRCRISYLPPDWGFNSDGKVKFIGLGHDEFKVQREKYGLPSVPERPKKKDGRWIYGKK